MATPSKSTTSVEEKKKKKSLRHRHQHQRQRQHHNSSLWCFSSPLTILPLSILHSLFSSIAFWASGPPPFCHLHRRLKGGKGRRAPPLVGTHSASSHKGWEIVCFWRGCRPVAAGRSIRRKLRALLPGNIAFFVVVAIVAAAAAFLFFFQCLTRAPTLNTSFQRTATFETNHTLPNTFLWEGFLAYLWVKLAYTGSRNFFFFYLFGSGFRVGWHAVERTHHFVFLPGCEA